MPKLNQNSPLRIGEVFLGEYQILELIGRGGYGAVYRAREDFTGRDVAVKVITCDRGGTRTAQDTFERGRQEAKILAEIEHPNIVKVYRAGETKEGHIFIVMELLRGPSLAKRLREGALSVEEGLRLLEGITEALALVHSKKVAHRDIKPGNIVFREDGTAVLLDFGIAKVAGGGAVRTGPNQVPGTALYISPEQLLAVTSSEKPAYELGDVYALGLVAFQVFQGSHPFAILEPNVTKLSAPVIWRFHLETKMPRLDDLIENFPSAVALLVSTALAKNPDNRIGSMKEFGEKARKARLNYLGGGSSAHFRPLEEEVPGSHVQDPVPAAITARIAPRSTKKQFQTDGPTQYVDIPVATLEPAASKRGEPVGTTHDPAVPRSSGIANPPTPQAASRTVTLPNATELQRKRSGAFFLSVGIVAGLGLVALIFPLSSRLMKDDDVEVIADSFEPLPTPHPASEPREAKASSDKPEVHLEESGKPDQEKPAASAPAKESPPKEPPPTSAPDPHRAARPRPSPTKTPTAPFVPKKATRAAPKPAPKPKNEDWKADLSGDGWIE